MYKNGRPARVVMTDAGLNDYINDILFVSYGYRIANHPSGSVRLPSDKDGINTKPQSRPENIVMRSADRIGMGIGQTRGLSLHAGVPPEWECPTLVRQGEDNFS